MPETHCCVPGCTTRIEDGVPLHRFPRPKVDKFRFKVWVSNIADELSAMNSKVVYFEKRVCSKHFKQSHKYTKARLNQIATPVLNMPDRPLRDSYGKLVATGSVTVPAKSNKKKYQENAISKSDIQPSDNILNQMAVFDFSKAIGETIIIEDVITEMEEDSVTNETKKKKPIIDKIIFEEDEMIEKQPIQGTKVSEENVPCNMRKRQPIDETILLEGCVTSDMKKRKLISVDTIISDMTKKKFINEKVIYEDSVTNIIKTMDSVTNNKKTNDSVANNSNVKKRINEKIIFEEDEIKEDGKAEIETSIRDLHTLSRNLISIVKAFYHYILRRETSFPSQPDSQMPMSHRKGQREFQLIKHKFFELSYNTMKTVILPQIKKTAFINQLLETTVIMANNEYNPIWKCEKRIVQTYFNELIQWTKQKSGYMLTKLKSPSIKNPTLNEQLIKPLQLFKHAATVSEPKSTSNSNTPSPPPKTQNNVISSTNTDQEISLSINTDTLINLIIDSHHRKQTETLECTENQNDNESSAEIAVRHTEMNENHVDDNEQINSNYSPQPYMDSELERNDPESSNSSIILLYEPDTEVTVSTQEHSTQTLESNRRYEDFFEGNTTPGLTIGDPSETPGQIIGDLSETPDTFIGDPLEMPLPAKRGRLSNPSGGPNEVVSTQATSTSEITQDTQSETINLVSPVTSTPPSPIPSPEASESCDGDVEGIPSIVKNAPIPQSSRDDEIYVTANYGSEYESDEEDDEEDIGFPVFMPRTQRIYFEDSDDDPPTQAPESSPTQAPEPSSTQAPEPSSTQAPEPSPTQVAKSSSTQAPKLSPTQAPQLLSTQAPELSPTQAPQLLSTQAPELSPTQAPQLLSTQAPQLLSTQAPQLLSTQAPELSPTQASEPSPTQAAEPSPTQTLEPSPAHTPEPGPPPSSPSPLPHQPNDLFNFEWRAFPNPPVPPTERREDFSDTNCGPTAPFLTPFDAFSTIWNRKFMKYIAEETNRYALQYAERQFQEGSLGPSSRITHWRETTADELYVYFGLLLATGLCIKADLKEYWSKDDVSATPGFGKYMSINRFSLLSRCIHFASNTTDLQSLTRPQAKLFKILPVIRHLNSKFEIFYRLNRNIVVDDSLTQWKGWLDGKHLGNKASVGIKTFEVSDAQSGYLWRIKALARGPVNESVTASLVLELLKGLQNKGHTVWMDNYYNSPAIARVLKSLRTDCVSTFRTLRQCVPTQLTCLKKTDLAVGQISGCTSGDVDVIVYKDRAAMLSTYHGRTIHTAHRKTKPLVIHDYNVCMSGIDKKDQILSSYPIERRRAQVWYKKLFRRLLNMSVYNAFILHRDSTLPDTPTRITKHREFRKTLIKELLSKQKVPPPSFTHTEPISSQVDRPMFSQDVLEHFPVEYGLLSPSSTKKERMRRSCALCHKRVQYYCPSCNVALCPSVCHRMYHDGNSF